MTRFSRFLLPISAWLAIASVAAVAISYDDEATTVTSRQELARDYQTSGGLDLQYSPISYPNYDYYQGVKAGKVGTGIHMAYDFMPFDNRYGKIGFGFGLGYDFIPTVALSNGTNASLNVFPIEGFVAYRADFVKDQILVPFGKIGPSVALINQSSTSGGGRSGVSTYYGFDMGGGIELCLSTLDKDSNASMIRVFGIHETYLVAEYLNSRFLGSHTGPDLSRDEFRIGLRFEM